MRRNTQRKFQEHNKAVGIVIISSKANHLLSEAGPMFIPAWFDLPL
jgi:hypothetical protein